MLREVKISDAFLELFNPCISYSALDGIFSKPIMLLLLTQDGVGAGCNQSSADSRSLCSQYNQSVLCTVWVLQSFEIVL